MSDPISPLINALHNQGRLRVWSLVITAFGDLVQDRGGEISTARLGALLGRVGIEQGTLRTALSRLNRDGWVTSTRSGRLSLYRLSEQGLDRFAPATTQIYAAPQTKPVSRWAMTLNISPDGAQQIELTPADASSPPADLRLTGAIDTISESYRATLLGEGQRLALDGLRDDLDALQSARLETDLDAAASRLLLIHRWRRITLRYGDIAPELMPADAPLKNPRLAVAEAYRRLAPAAEAWLDSGDGDLAPMPPADARLARRFGGLQEA
ncbi:PaaX family transcriptional regulator C-terminal domain-containing protein [Phaeobacter sp. 22II1-1F12B]|uniref:PaaX family transcriptional regulator C-terminal domain-containing protein n=1 Tax=Phaeobacter sp. 22II1-1F12B TaxID=1317111 RepID=UPI000B5201FE|nr:PaaX family transcriptional regulator C-terminal domain-containing protein [Phaeobacter sp. 22II1-1F12B]OWU82710.1 hypothetical protein ATO1_02095 [Phaeobacter sp. 22II1-1F12B]